jgi:hypothetical protein
MTAAIALETVHASRPLPGPGYRVAPPALDAYAPWAAVLEHSLTPGQYTWVMGAEGALVPVPLPEDEAATLRTRTAVGVRLSALLRR